MVKITAPPDPGGTAVGAVVGPGAGSALLRSVRELLGGLASAQDEGEAIDRIRALEEIKSVCAAAQARESVALDGLRRQREADDGVPARKRCASLGAEIALARREPAHQGGRHLGLARALCQEMPNTLDALSAGRISEHQATVVARETAWLAVEHRRMVDELMSDRLGSVGTKTLAAEAKAHAQRLDQEAAVRQLERSRRERRVSVRPALGGMSYLTALVPMPQAVAALAALQRDAATAVGVGDEQARTRDQIMADLLVERLTGQGSASAVPVEVHLVMTDAALMGRDPAPAWIPGQGPIPAEQARHLMTDPDAEVFLRRLFTRPEDGQLVAMDSRSRVFPPLLRRMILLRDDVCRTPWCDAPIRHADHVRAHHDGGATSFDNGSGLCAQCNLVKENAGWQHESSAGGLAVTTPTGHHYVQQNASLTVWANRTGSGPPDRPPAFQQQDSITERFLDRCLRDHRQAHRLARLARLALASPPMRPGLAPPGFACRGAPNTAVSVLEG